MAVTVILPQSSSLLNR